MFMTYLFIYQPLYNILALLAAFFKGNVGWAIFTLAVLLRLCLLPFNRKTMAAQSKLLKLQPKMKEIQNKYKQDPSQANKEIMELFKQEKVSPYGPLGGVVIQLVFFIFLYIFFRQAIASADWTPHLYSFIKLAPVLNYQFLGLIDLKAISLPLTLLSAVINVFLAMLQPSAPGQNKTMLLLIPFVVVFYYKIFPAAIIVYWIAISLVGILEALIDKKVLLKEQKTI